LTNHVYGTQYIGTYWTMRSYDLYDTTAATINTNEGTPI
jgi:hypothetical protein